jgi:hypothetical protein
MHHSGRIGRDRLSAAKPTAGRRSPRFARRRGGRGLAAHEQGYAKHARFLRQRFPPTRILHDVQRGNDGRGGNAYHAATGRRLCDNVQTTATTLDIFIESVEDFMNRQAIIVWPVDDVALAGRCASSDARYGSNDYRYGSMRSNEDY